MSMMEFGMKGYMNYYDYMRFMDGFMMGFWFGM